MMRRLQCDRARFSMTFALMKDLSEEYCLSWQEAGSSVFRRMGETPGHGQNSEFLHQTTAPTLPLNPRNVGLFRQGHLRDEKQVDWLVVGVVLSEPFPLPHFPDTRENAGNFTRFWWTRTKSREKCSYFTKRYTHGISH